jgi:hypothetical protein
MTCQPNGAAVYLTTKPPTQTTMRCNAVRTGEKRKRKENASWELELAGLRCSGVSYDHFVMLMLCRDVMPFRDVMP